MMQKLIDFLHKIKSDSYESMTLSNKNFRILRQIDVVQALQWFF